MDNYLVNEHFYDLCKRYCKVKENQKLVSLSYKSDEQSFWRNRDIEKCAEVGAVITDVVKNQINLLLTSEEELIVLAEFYKNCSVESYFKITYEVELSLKDNQLCKKFMEAYAKNNREEMKRISKELSNRII